VSSGWIPYQRSSTWHSRGIGEEDRRVDEASAPSFVPSSTLTEEAAGLGTRDGQPSTNEFSGTNDTGGGGDGPGSGDGAEDGADYYANMGDALRILRDDIPQLFRKELNYSIYRDDVMFTDSRLEFQGIKNYKIIFWSLRFHGQLFFRHMNVDILRIWQPEDYCIKMRWKIVGIPRVWWEAEGVIDGISTYKLDKKGKIYEHSITNVQLRDPPITNPLLYGLNWVYYPNTEPQLGGLTPGG
jgi:hypothetical protein